MVEVLDIINLKNWIVFLLAYLCTLFILLCYACIKGHCGSVLSVNSFCEVTFSATRRSGDNVISMDKAEHGLLLHEAIKLGDLHRFNDLLQMPNLDVNMQNEDGDTPLLTSLKHAQSREFIERLLAAGANVTIANNERITPLSFAIADSFDITLLLLEKCKDTEFLYEMKLSVELHQAVKTNTCRFITFVTNLRLDNEEIVLFIAASNSLYSDNMAIRELNVFLDYLDTADDMGIYDFYKISSVLLRGSLHLDNSAVFKAIWKRVDHTYMTYIMPFLLWEFVRNCEYENSEFIECLFSILTSSCASKLNVNYRIMYALYSMTFYEDLFGKLSSKDINKKERIRILLISTQFVPVSFDDVASAYDHFRFNEEVIILLRHLDPTLRCCHSRQFIFMVELENDEKFSVDNLNRLDFIIRACYRKLICNAPQEVVGCFRTIKLKKQMLSEVPRLFELSVPVSQMCIQKFYNIHDRNQFDKIVDNLCIPNQLKRNLRYEPPLDFV
ncbi:hypothetical protein ILUMI_13182 [Ignelater luminosus]|uniref:SOCS box domain-containing protein n=1 Tax=Ignelater luminosus TaxID=2038154 RepID=A0A8K0D1B4_IGNLU|nr:hypothetical protein ILUMI_13182 [Ignelater luminosus]